MKKRSPSPQQVRVLDEIKRHWFSYGVPPSTAEIATLLGVSRQNIHHHVMNLKRQGFLSDTEDRERAFVPTPEKFDAHATTSAIPRTAFQVRLIPILGQVAAGVPILAQEKVEGGLWIEWSNLSDTLFALRVRGDSMIKVGIYHDDLVIIRQQLTASDGDIVLALVDQDEATIKRLKRRGGLIGLFPENDTMKPFWYPPQRVIFQGVVIESRRYYKVYKEPAA